MGTIGALATFKDRIGIVEDTINSLIDQLDLLLIYCNDEESYHSARRTLAGNVKKFRGVNITDRGKFFFCKELKGLDHVYFSMDDDLIYPKDYVSETLKSLQKYNQKAIVSYHGKKLIERGVKSYYAKLSDRQYRNDYRVLDRVTDDVAVDIVGAGCTAFNLQYFCPEDLKEDMMTDIEVSCMAERENKKRIVLKHRQGWVIENPKMVNKWTIWKHFQKTSDFRQTQLLNETFK